MLSSPGIGSGLNVSSIVDQLLALEQRSLRRLDAREGSIQAQISAFGEIKSALSTFETNMQALSSAEKFQTYSAKSSNKEALTATAGSSAAKGVFNIDVSRIAENHRMAATTVYADTGTTLIGTAGETITITTGSGSSTVEFGGKTLAEIRDAINESSTNPGITASIIKDDTGYYLTLSANNTGSSSAMTSITYSGADAFALLDLNSDRDGDLSFTPADLDAELVVEGQFTITNETNSISDAIEGVTLNLVASGTTTLTVDRDTGMVRDNIKQFVDSYNSVMSLLRAQRTGAFSRDTATLTNIESQLRVVLNTPASTGGPYTFLSEIGVRSTRAGTLEIDDSALDAALEGNLSAVSDLFAMEDQGFAVRFANLANEFVETGGTIGTRLETLNERITQIGRERLRENVRLDSVEKRLLREFTALDTLVASLNTTSSFLTQQLQNLPAATNRGRNNSQ
jgi:flagellar hook-associated protein 2